MKEHWDSEPVTNGARLLVIEGHCLEDFSWADVKLSATREYISTSEVSFTIKYIRSAILSCNFRNDDAALSFFNMTIVAQNYASHPS